MTLEKFDEAFEKCLEDGVHPGPAEINDRLGRGRRTSFNGGREVRRRRELMRLHKIPFKRDSPYGRAGEVPGSVGIKQEIKL